MRDIPASAVTAAVKALCVPANNQLPPDVEAAVRGAYESEPWPIAKQTLGTLCQNLDAARATGLPICQDTGMACVFAEIGQDVHITGGSFEEAVDEGVRQGYTEGYLRKSVVADPIRRGNTGDNTPAVLTVRLVPGDKLRLTLAPKGFGSENMSRLAMLRPSDGEQGVKDFVLDAVRRAGPNPCPPVVVGVGIGGTRSTVWPFLQSGLCCARWAAAIRTRTMRPWNRSFWKRSTNWARGRRASAGGPRRLGCRSKHSPRTSRACLWR